MNCANHLDRERIAFCQNCGKPLCQECIRTVGSATYCEPCLAAKLAGAASSAPGTGSYGYNGAASAAYTSPAIAGAPNPLLAGFLGFIPGVGAMYNEQYFKGIVHLVVFAILVSLFDNHGIFGLFIAGWEFYMAIEAYHTARARRDGQPLPNPFGLNELGERFGFGKSWPSGGTAPAPMPPDPYAAPYTAPYSGSYTAPTTSNPAAGPAQPFAAPYSPPYAPSGVPPGGMPQNWGVPLAPPWQQYAAPVPPVPPVPLDEQVPYPGNRFPAGALWLIGFGALFLIANAGFLHGFSYRLFVPLLLIGLAVFIFVKKMLSSGAGLSSDGSAAYRLRVFRALRGSIWLALVGLLFFLDEFRILSWGHSWPLFIIVAGVMTVLERAAYSATVSNPIYDPAAYAASQPGYGMAYGYPPQPSASVSPAPPVEPISTTIVPATHDEEGN